MSRRALGLLLLLPLLTGCWDIIPIEEIGFVGLLAVDHNRHGYHVTVEMPTPLGNASGSQGGGSGQEGGTGAGMGGGPPGAGTAGRTVYGQGASFIAALTEAQAHAQVRLWFGVTQALLFTERAARDGSMASVLDYFDRRTESRNIEWVFLIPDRAYTHIAETIPGGNLPGRPLATQALLGRLYSPVKPVRLYEFLRDAADPGRAAALPVLTIRSGLFHFAREAALPHGRLTGVLPQTVSRGLPWLIAMETVSLEDVLPGGQPLAVTFREPTHRVRPRFDQHGHLLGFDVHLTATMDVLQEGPGAGSLDSPVALRRGARGAASLVVQQVRATLAAAQAAHADIFGFGDVVRALHPRLFAHLAGRWNEEVFPHLSFRVVATVWPAATGYLQAPALLGPSGGAAAARGHTPARARGG